MRKFIQLFTVAIIAFSASILSADIKPAVIYDMVENLINRLMKVVQRRSTFYERNWY